MDSLINNSTSRLYNSITSNLPQDALSKLNEINMQILRNSVPTVQKKINQQKLDIIALKLSLSPTLEQEKNLVRLENLQAEIWAQLNPS